MCKLLFRLLLHNSEPHKEVYLNNYRFHLFRGRTVPGSIPGGVTGFFSDISPSDRSMALGSTQPLVKMRTRNIPGGKGGPCVRLTSPPSRAECQEIREPKPPGTLWATPGLLRDSFTFTSSMSVYTFLNEIRYEQLIRKIFEQIHLLTLLI
jgi:hypothetical protein